MKLCVLRTVVQTVFFCRFTTARYGEEKGGGGTMNHDVVSIILNDSIFETIPTLNITQRLLKLSMLNALYGKVLCLSEAVRCCSVTYHKQSIRDV